MPVTQACCWKQSCNLGPAASINPSATLSDQPKPLRDAAIAAHRTIGTLGQPCPRLHAHSDLPWPWPITGRRIGHLRRDSWRLSARHESLKGGPDGYRTQDLSRSCKFRRLKDMKLQPGCDARIKNELIAFHQRVESIS